MKIKFDTKTLRIVSVILCLVFIFFLAFFSAKGDSATVDEPAHIAAGMIKLQYGDFNFFIEQPPLINSLSAVPVLLAGYKIKNNYFTPQNHWGYGRDFLYNSGNNAKTILLLARLPIIILFVILCCFFFFATLKITKSFLISFVGLILIGMEPNLMAHARLATADLGATLFTFITIILFIKYLFYPKKFLVYTIGILAGLSLLTKISALIIIPYFFIIILFFCLINKKDTVFVKKIFFDFSKILIITAFTICFFYLLELTNKYITYEHGSNNLLNWLGSPIYEYLKSIKQIQRWVFENYNQPQYLLGKFSFSGWWYYYPIAFILKTSILYSLLYFCSLFIMIYEFLYKKNREKIIQILLYINIFIFILFFVGMKSNLDIGIRYMLPTFPFIILSICIFLFYLIKSKFFSYKTKVVLIAIISIYSIFNNLSTFPSYLSYFNEFISSQNKDKYLIDSNLDMEQDVYRLENYLLQNNYIDPIYADAAIFKHNTYFISSRVKSIDSSDATEEGYYIVKRHNYICSQYYYPKSGSWPDMMKDAQLIKIIGDSIYVFKK
ncbi:MAG: hypothetical protein WCW17_03155 [Patescibacteria group bacterium]